MGRPNRTVKRSPGRCSSIAPFTSSTRTDFEGSRSGDRTITTNSTKKRTTNKITNDRFLPHVMSFYLALKEPSFDHLHNVTSVRGDCQLRGTLTPRSKGFMLGRVAITARRISRRIERTAGRKD